MIDMWVYCDATMEGGRYLKSGGLHPLRGLDRILTALIRDTDQHRQQTTDTTISPQRSGIVICFHIRCMLL